MKTIIRKIINFFKEIENSIDKFYNEKPKGMPKEKWEEWKRFMWDNFKLN